MNDDTGPDVAEDEAAEFVHVAAYKQDGALEFTVNVDQWALLWNKSSTAMLLHSAADALRLAANEFGPPLAHHDGPRAVPTDGGDDEPAE